MKKFYAYMLLTERGTYYCGYTDDVEARFKKHCEGKAAKYTRANKPIKIVYTKEFDTKIEAQAEERRIKKFSHKEREKLANAIS